MSTLRPIETLVALCFLAMLGCGDSSSGSGSSPEDVDTGRSDAVDVETTDAAPDSITVEDSSADTTEDSAADAVGDTDIAQEDVPQDTFEPGPALETPIVLSLEDAEIWGDTPLLVDRDGRSYRLLSPGGGLAWQMSAAPTEQVRANLEVEAALWRQEGASLSVSLEVADGESSQVQAELHRAWAIPAWASIVDWRHPPERGFGTDFAPWPTTLLLDPGARLTIATAEPAGHLRVYGARLVPPAQEALHPLEEDAFLQPEPSGTRVEAAPCDEPGCDDALALGALLEAQDEGPVVLRMAPGVYTFRSPWVIRRGGVALVGAGADQTEIFWDPAQEPPSRAGALTFQGTRDGTPIWTEAIEADSRRVTLPEESLLTPGDRVLLQGDDYGEVPLLCRVGRDAETDVEHRNLQWFATVTEVNPGDEEGSQVLALDRHTSYPVPLDASPRLHKLQLLTGIYVSGIRLRANCPEAEELMAQPQADCTNPYILDNSALRLILTEGAVVRDVEVTWFGRYAVEVTQSRGARVIGGGMTKPAAYGGGGEGYGVHLIRSSQSLVHGYEVVQARHGVVIDFGSTESQVVSSTFVRQGLAAIDIHGEYSHDTLLLENTLQDCVQGLIVGGGGQETHCNDGPRHHMIGNTIAGSQLSAINIVDYSRQIRVRQNRIEDTWFGVVILAGAGDVWLDRNHFAQANQTHVSALDGDDGTGPLRLTDNLFGEAPLRLDIEEGINVQEEGVYAPEDL